MPAPLVADVRRVGKLSAQASGRDDSLHRPARGYCWFGSKLIPAEPEAGMVTELFHRYQRDPHRHGAAHTRPGSHCTTLNHSTRSTSPGTPLHGLPPAQRQPHPPMTESAPDTDLALDRARVFAVQAMHNRMSWMPDRRRITVTGADG
ncbi:hypothetical protein AB0H12_32380 [Actinosynnema sp. NPDC023794]